MRMTKRIRARVDRLTPRGRSAPARVFRIEPETGRPFVVEVRIARHRRHMREEVLRLDGQHRGIDRDCMGMVRHWGSKIGFRLTVRPRQVIARMYLNTRDLRQRPSEIVAHECTHAGMAWARLQRANLRVMDGEEVLCHSVGRMVAQVNRICYAHGVWS